MDGVMIIKITEDEFDERFKPMTNHFERAKADKDTADEDVCGFSGCMFETYDEELDFVFDLSQKEKRVWTIIEGDDDDMYYVTGFHYLNRIGFLVTEEAYDKEYEVKLDW